MIPAFCPRCGDAANLFELLPDVTRTMPSIACAACHAKAATPGQDGRHETGADTCSKCGQLTFARWKFCVQCRTPVTRPS